MKLKLNDWILLGIMALALAGAFLGSVRAYEELTFNPKLVARASWTLPKVYLPNHSEEQNRLMNKAFRVSGGDKDFLYTLRGENGTMEPERRSNMIGKNGYYDWGLCQLNYQWHKKFIDSDAFKSSDEQIKYCWNVFSRRPTAFYAYYTRSSQKKYFKF